MSSFHEFKCPHCSIDIEVEVFRWSSKGICPSCNQPFEVDYDFTVGGDGDEFDMHWLNSMSKEEYEKDRLTDISPTRLPTSP